MADIAATGGEATSGPGLGLSPGVPKLGRVAQAYKDAAAGPSAKRKVARKKRAVAKAAAAKVKAIRDAASTGAVDAKAAYKDAAAGGGVARQRRRRGNDEEIGGNYDYEDQAGGQINENPSINSSWTPLSGLQNLPTEDLTLWDEVKNIGKTVGSLVGLFPGAGLVVNTVKGLNDAEYGTLSAEDRDFLSQYDEANDNLEEQTNTQDDYNTTGQSSGNISASDLSNDYDYYGYFDIGGDDGGDSGWGDGGFDSAYSDSDYSSSDGNYAFGDAGGV